MPGTNAHGPVAAPTTMVYRSASLHRTAGGSSSHPELHKKGPADGDGPGGLLRTQFFESRGPQSGGSGGGRLNVLS